MHERETVAVVGVKHLGRIIAETFGARRARVVCVARTRDDVERAAAEVTAAGGEGVPLVADITKPETLAPLAGLGLDLCVAAQSPDVAFGARPMLEKDDDELVKSWTTTVRGTWNLLRAVGPGMVARKRGTFLQMGTSSGVRARDGFAVLGASQAGLRGLVLATAREWRAHGVHVAYVPIDGPIASDASKAWQGSMPDGAFLDPRAIAETCAHLHEQPPRAWTHELVLRPSIGEWSLPT